MSTEFDLGQALPPSGTTTILEASAGTGKTYTLAGLVARFIGEGVRLDQILAVTFSRRATGELRDEIRERLERSCAVLAGEFSGELDPVDAVLRTAASEPAADQVLGRFSEAISQLDDAPILTYHAFASRMLDELGLLADHDQSTRLVTDLQELADQAIADAYLAQGSPGQQLSWSLAHKIGRAAIAHPFEAIHPTDEPAAADRVQYAEQVRVLFDQRKRARRVLGYDDMIARLAAALTDPQTGRLAAEQLSERFRVVLVDEFQDTDPAQWRFLQAAFAGRSTMILIGDPKQAIYRFRGGDIETYLAARGAAQQQWRLAHNYRSDQAVVAGVHSLFHDLELGLAGSRIIAHPVAAAKPGSRVQHRETALPQAVQIRALRGSAVLDEARRQVRSDVVTQIADLIGGDYQIFTSRQPGQSPNWHRVDARDIAVLVNTNAFGADLQQLLTRAGHPAIFTGSGSVYASEAADAWLSLLEALETPRASVQRRALLTPLIGWSSADLAEADADRLVTMIELLSRCAQLLASQGVAAVFETLISECEIYPRLLAQPDGEELLTDLRHVAELLNQAQRADQLSAAGLAEYLRRAQRQARTDQDERTRRLPTDRPAITIMTVHAAKGLQFPIVLLPQATDARLSAADRDEPVIGHQGGRRVLDVADPNTRGVAFEGYQDEEAAEALRAFYVACTRAQSLLICWWSDSYWTPTSPLHRLLHSTREGTVPARSYDVTSADDLSALPGVGLQVIDPAAATALPAAPDPNRSGPPRSLSAREFRDRIDRAWVRTSYTGLTAALHATAPAEPWIESDEVTVSADSEPSSAAQSIVSAPDAPVSALADQPGGVSFGSLVHAVLEQVDPAAPDAAEQLLIEVRRQAAGFPINNLDAEAVAAGLWQTITTGLGVLTDDLSLRDIGGHDMVCELDFELPLGDGLARARVGDLARLFDALDAADPIRQYGHQLGESAAADQILAGFLTGSIDVVARVGGDRPRYLVFDYKTNRVPVAAGVGLTATHYTPTAMTAAMCEAHYPLQALLYQVALHRYLGWRLPGYQPEANLGGVGYLFVRGMTGADNPQLGTMPAGVFTWRPPAAMVVAASELLAGGGKNAR